MPMATREEQRRYQREWLARRRAAWFEGKSCVDCGATEGLEIDHRDPAEKVSHRIWSWSQERIENETAKCEVRCDPCHRKRHRRHGISRYQYGCRCDVCRAAKSAAMKRETRRKRRGSNAQGPSLTSSG